MVLPQAKFREVVFQLLYSKIHGNPGDKELIDLIMRELQVTRKAVRQGLERAEEVLEKLKFLDAKITEVSTSFSFERIQAVEKTLLRLGVYEVLVDDEVPPKVAITEAMRLARKFSTNEAACFVNALLDAIYKESLGEEVDTVNLESTTKALSESEELAERAQRHRPVGED
jgi:N utilization substance protein B